MRAVVAHGPGEFRFEEVDRPVAGEGNPPYIDAPVIPGHEFIGHIVELGDNVDACAHHGDTGFEFGDRVISEQIVPTYRPVIDWIESGELPTDGVVTHRLPLEEWDAGFEMVDKGDESIKVILEP